jgi:hypothetical protein
MILIDLVEYATLQGKDMGIEQSMIRKAADIEAAIKKFLPVLENSTSGRPGEIAAPGLGALTGGIPQ